MSSSAQPKRRAWRPSVPPPSAAEQEPQGDGEDLEFEVVDDDEPNIEFESVESDLDDYDWEDDEYDTLPPRSKAKSKSKAKKKRDDDENSVTSSHRSSRNRVRWRGGAAPAPPTFEPYYETIHKTPRLYRKWVRRVEMWKIRVKPYKPVCESALDLVDAIKGDAEADMEYLPITDLSCDDGIDKIVKHLATWDDQKVL